MYQNTAGRQSTLLANEAPNFRCDIEKYRDTYQVSDDETIGTEALREGCLGFETHI